MALTDTQLGVVELYKIVLAGNYSATACFTNGNTDVIYDGNTYQAIPITRSNIGYHSNLEVDKVEITFGLVSVTVGTLNLTIPKLVKSDFLKNAHIYIYLYDTENSVSLQTLFEGYLTGDINYNRGTITASFGSILDKLKDKFPKLIYSEFCNHNLFNSYCGLTKASYLHTATCTVGSTTTMVYGNVLFSTTHALGYWDKGELIFTSGNNNGISKTIRKHYDGYVILNTPLPYIPSISDSFNVYPGCDKSGIACATKFDTDNYDNFLGFETIPNTETLYS
jgi:uncharacterized phage protein (TIGR02218 family)